MDQRPALIGKKRPESNYVAISDTRESSGHSPLPTLRDAAFQSVHFANGNRPKSKKTSRDKNFNRYTFRGVRSAWFAPLTPRPTSLIPHASPSRGSSPCRIDATFHTRTSPHVGRAMAERFVFSDLRDLFAKANEKKSGDQLAGIAARSEQERVAAKRQLADLTLDEIVRRPLIDPSGDEVTRLILDTFDEEGFHGAGGVASMTVGGR